MLDNRTTKVMIEEHRRMVQRYIREGQHEAATQTHRPAQRSLLSRVLSSVTAPSRDGAERAPRQGQTRHKSV